MPSGELPGRAGLVAWATDQTKGRAMMDLTAARTVVARLIEETLAADGRPAGQVSDEQSLFAGGLGLDSLQFAALVVRLERETGRDPFRGGQAPRLPRTVGELAALYAAP